MWNWILQNGLTILGFGGYAVVGALVLLGYFKKNDGRQAASDKVADGLIDRLQKTVDQNAKDMGAMSLRIDAQQKEIHQLQGKNEAYLQIISLRDPATAKVFQEAPEIFKIAKENNELSRANGAAISTLTSTISRFIDALQPILVHLEASGIVRPDVQ